MNGGPDIIHEFDPGFELKRNKFHIGLAKNGQPNNSVVFRAQTNSPRIEPSVPAADDRRDRLDQAGLELVDYDSRWGRRRIRLTKQDLRQHKDLLSEMLRKAYESRTSRCPATPAVRRNGHTGDVR